MHKSADQLPLTDPTLPFKGIKNFEIAQFLLVGKISMINSKKSEIVRKFMVGFLLPNHLIFYRLRWIIDAFVRGELLRDCLLRAEIRSTLKISLQITPSTSEVKEFWSFFAY